MFMIAFVLLMALFGGFFSLILVGLDTDPLWKGFYHETWARKSRWPDVYFKKKGISKGSEGWRVCYLQRCLQDALNCRRVLSQVTSCSPSEGTAHKWNTMMKNDLLVHCKIGINSKTLLFYSAFR